MLEEISKIKGLEVYAPNGIFVGYADKYVIDPNDKRVTGILLESANPVLVDPVQMGPVHRRRDNPQFLPGTRPLRREDRMII